MYINPKKIIYTLQDKEKIKGNLNLCIKGDKFSILEFHNNFLLVNMKTGIVKGVNCKLCLKILKKRF